MQVLPRVSVAVRVVRFLGINETVLALSHYFVTRYHPLICCCTSNIIGICSRGFSQRTHHSSRKQTNLPLEWGDMLFANHSLALYGFLYSNSPFELGLRSIGRDLVILSGFAFVFCIFLYFKGLYFPSSTDSGSSGNIVWDFYWGTELHPQIFNFNLKQYCNCRLGMMGWHVLLLCCIAKQLSMSGGSASLDDISPSLLASVIVQEIYILKFFIWEAGYFASLDIMHDRFGYYICWGVLSWIAGVYTLVAQYLTLQPQRLTSLEFYFIVGFGIFLTWANYDADAQRQRVRDTKGNCTVWGQPPKILMAKYKTTDGKEHQNILLLSGWWGVSRHAHYVTEILLALVWTLPAGRTHVLPYFYVVYLTVLLTDRSYRDDKRCRAKYGGYWKKYCETVKYNIVPFIY